MRACVCVCIVYSEMLIVLSCITNSLYQVINEEGFVGDARTEASDIQETLDTYDTPRLVKF